ncbi:MAG TPA: MBL fold metallo-hydrolase [Chitinophagaceae bacterium]|jgi:glyoxylase-like metal-dependent hydrolase (beta-lactamase superfamily II)|nr:MBL fold metallo-hydrolase [Chitinophagaceae bacterium]
MQRREFLRSNSILFGALPFIHAERFNIFKTRFFTDDVVKIKIGKLECTVFRDYMFKYLAKDFFMNAKEEELNQSLNKYHITADNIPSPFIAVLVQHDDKKILIDTGVGFSEKPIIVRGNSILFKGRLHQLLQQENIKKEDITDVIITHFHPDHIGGIFSEDDKLNFPNARFHMHEHEWGYWHSTQSDNQPAQFKYFIEKNITKLKERNLQLIKNDFVDMLPGITAVKADGHTPGQIALIIHSEKKHLLYISDSFLHPLHIERLNWQTNYDLDHEKAKQSRVKLLELAYKENMLVNAFHFDFPCLGRIDKHDNGWIWNYSEK